MFCVVLFYVLLFVEAVDLKLYHKKDLAHTACGFLIGRNIMPFSRFNHQDLVYCDATDQPALGSMMLCLTANFNHDYVDHFIKSCDKFNLSHHEAYQAKANATNYAVPASYYTLQVNISDHGQNPALHLPFVYPIKLKPHYVHSFFHSLVQDYQTTNWEFYFGMALTGYWFVVMFIAAVFHWMYFLCPRWVQSLHGPRINWLRRHFTLPPTGNYLHISEAPWALKCYVPTRLETLILAGWFCLMFVFCFVHQVKPIEGLRIGTIGERLAYLCLYSFPLLVLFAGRNNFMQWVTGWGYARFLTFHRWTSRVVYVFMLLHAILETRYLMDSHEYTTFGRTSPVIWGYVGITSLSIMVGLSLYILRSWWYEVFLTIHILMAVVTFTAGWIHTRRFGGVEIFYCVVAVWGFERAIRLLRIITFGVQRATLVARTPDTVKITVQRPSYWLPFPGSHAFVYFMKPLYFWQSHPFTVVDLLVLAHSISFYVKVKEGMSRKLYRESCLGQLASVRVLVEGPYGQSTAIRHYDTAVFFAGGNGVPGMYFEARELARTVSANLLIKQIKFYWVIRQIQSVDWFLEELKNLDYSFVDVIIYVTGTPVDDEWSQNSKPSDQENHNTISDDSLAIDEKNNYQIPPGGLGHVSFRSGRPDIGSIVEHEVFDANGLIGFVTCGAGTMVDDARKAVRDNLSLKKRVDLFEQVQEW